MDKLLNEFTVNRPIDETWKVLTDVERIAPCMPGATLEEIEGDVFRGVVKVKLGAISTAFKGQASFIERDDADHRAVLKGEGRDTTGKGNASALITAKLGVGRRQHDEGRRRDRPAHHRQGRPVRTRDHGRCQQEADEPVRHQPQHDARPAAHHCAVRTEAGRRQPPPTHRGAEPAPRRQRPTARPRRDRSVAASRHRTTGASAVRKINGPAAAPIELSDVAGSAILKRVLPLVGGLVLLWIIVRRLSRR